MSQASSVNPEALSRDQRLDRVCGPFEAACKAAQQGGPWPRIEDFLDAAAEPERAALVQELILLDLHYRRRAGQSPEAGVYQARFPDLDPGWLTAALEGPGEAPPLPLTQIAVPAFSDGADGPPQALPSAVPERLGEFHILREVGRGGMGVVYEAIQESLNRHVALKVLPFSSLLGPTQLERFRREARAAAGLHHTNIVPVFGVGEDSGVHFFAMQYIEGQSLDRVLREVQRLRKIPDAPAASHALASQVAEALLGGRFSPAKAERVAAGGPGLAAVISPAQAGCGAQPVVEVSDGNNRSETGYFRAVARVGVQVADALEYAHRQGVLHRDIKPANLLLDTAGTVWITDFGLAKLEGNEALTSPGDLVGTLRYMAPERFEGRSEPRSDVYSLGLTLYEMLTLRPAFPDLDPVALIEHVRREAPPALRRINPRIPRDLETIVLKAMAREPGDRYATAGALAEDLRHFLADRPIRARRSSTLEHCWRWCRRNRAVAALAAGLLLALVILAIGSTVAYVLVGFQRDRAQVAELEKTHKLWESYVEQAHARRLTRQAGQRFDSLEILRNAIDLGRSLELTPEQILRMRNEAIACLALKDLRFERQLEPKFEDNHYVAFDGRLEYYAVSDLEGTISIRSTSQDSEIAQLPKPAVAPARVTMKLTGDGQYLVIAYALPRQPAEVFRWELQDGKPTAKLRLEQAGAAFAIAPDDRQVAAERMDGSIGIYDLSSGQLQNRVAQARNLELIVFHPDGRKLGFCAKGSRGLVVLDLETGKSSSYDHAAVVNSAAWRPDGRLLAVACNDQRIHVWDTATGRPQAALEGHINNGIDVAFSHGGELLASRGWDGTTRLWDAVTGREILRARGSFVAWRADGEQLVLYRDDHVELWEMAGFRECRTLHHGLAGNRKDRPNGAGPACIDFGLQGRLLASASLDGVRLWDISAPATEIAHLPVGFAQTAYFQPGDANLLTYSETGLCLWPIQPRPNAAENCFALGPPQIVYPLSGIRRPRASWAGDGRSLIAADFGRSRALLLHLDKPGKPVEFKPHPSIDNVTLSPDGRWAVTRGHHSDRLIVWDSRTGKPVWQRSLTWPNVAFSRDGSLLATCSREKGVHLWDVPSWQPRLFVPTKEPGSFDMAFDPQGTFLAVGEQFLGIRLIAPATGRDFATLEAPDDPQSAGIAFSPDGAQLATGTGNHTIHLWDLRLIRQEVAELGLDWDLPPYPPAEDHRRPVRLEVRLDAGLFYTRAQQWAGSRDYARAIADLRACLEMEPGRADACNLLAWYLVAGTPALRNPAEALPFAQKAVAARPDDGNCKNTLALIYYRLGRYQEAVDILTRNLQEHRGYWTPCDGFVLAMSYQRLGQTDKARACYFQAVLDTAAANLTRSNVELLNAFREEAAALLALPGKP